MTQKEATIRVNISVLENLMKNYGTNRSLGNVADNERARLRFYEKQAKTVASPNREPSQHTENDTEKTPKNCKNPNVKGH